MKNKEIRSAYVHFPFCQKKCPYCDFVSYPLPQKEKEGYIDALLKEMEITKHLVKEKTPLSTVYLGGGTPSLFSPKEIRRVLDGLSGLFSFAPEAEITMEVNPGTVSMEALLGYKKAGVNRISMGVQSFSDSILKNIGRIHDAAQATTAIQMVKAVGFSNFSCDLMTGLPGQTEKDAIHSLFSLLDLGVPHISFYALSIEEGTPFYQMYQKREELLPTQEEERRMYHQMLSSLEKKGYRQYEISNCSLPGFESRHNLSYWKALPYYGFGCGAHSYYLGKRRGNTASIEEYQEALEKENPSLLDFQQVEEDITAADEKKEFMLLGFRVTNGVSEEEYQKRFGAELLLDFGDEIEGLLRQGYIDKKDGRIFIKKEKLDVANIVFREFV